MAQHNDLGKKGESLAVDHLEKNGYIILERNYRFDKAEVDIIALVKEGDNYTIEHLKDAFYHF